MPIDYADLIPSRSFPPKAQIGNQKSLYVFSLFSHQPKDLPQEHSYPLPSFLLFSSRTYLCLRQHHCSLPPLTRKPTATTPPTTRTRHHPVNRNQGIVPGGRLRLGRRGRPPSQYSLAAKTGYACSTTLTRH